MEYYLEKFFKDNILNKEVFIQFPIDNIEEEITCGFKVYVKNIKINKLNFDNRYRMEINDEIYIFYDNYKINKNDLNDTLHLYRNKINVLDICFFVNKKIAVISGDMSDAYDLKDKILKNKKFLNPNINYVLFGINQIYLSQNKNLKFDKIFIDKGLNIETYFNIKPRLIEMLKDNDEQKIKFK